MGDSQAQQPPTTGLLDLEKELTCSVRMPHPQNYSSPLADTLRSQICTDILYQPLTILDCLHTFCGSCLKEWFSWQSTQQQQDARRDRRRAPRYTFTCPSCRAIARETRPNATVTTLLDMWIQANPGRVRTKDEKEEVAKIYKVGDRVLPLPPPPPPAQRPRGGVSEDREGNETDEEEDRRLLEEVREMSLRELRGGGTSRGGGRHNIRNERQALHVRAPRDDRHALRDDGNHSIRSRVTNRREEPPTHAPGATGRDLDGGTREPRQVEHQSSLRSFLSISDLDSQEMEEEIMRQIVQNGLLNGIDLNHIDVSQEDEISERIAEAYRRRRERDRGGPVSSEEVVTQGREYRHESPHIFEHGSTASRPTPVTGTSRAPPLSRPHLFDAGATARLPQRRSTSHGSGQLLRPESTSEVSRSTAPSATEWPQMRETSYDTTRRLHGYERRRTDPISTSISELWRRGAPGISPAPVSMTTVGSTTQTHSTNNRSASLIPSALAEASTPLMSLDRPEYPDPSSHFVEPSISCVRCNRQHIEYQTHYTCSKCAATTGSNTYALCSRCYRLGKGCRNWYGFGYAARAKYERQAPTGGYPPGQDLPHILSPHRYLRPIPALPNPADRLQQGLFCYMCHENANACYWHCEICNDGECGFCNDCVNQGKHCTHPLSPLAYNNANAASTRERPATGYDVPHELESLPIHTTCNICGLPIVPSRTRFHCPTCNAGDYDICRPCYDSLFLSGQINAADGDKGWRKCLKGHRMLVVGFEDREHGKQRIVVEEVVGGWAWVGHEDGQESAAGGSSTEEQPDRIAPQRWSYKDDAAGGYKTVKRPASSSVQTNSHTTLPPSGGYGLRMLALWGRVPDEGVEDELEFPRGAQITEVVDINGDWCWGMYCRRSGLFPGGFGRVLQ